MMDHRINGPLTLRNKLYIHEDSQLQELQPTIPLQKDGNLPHGGDYVRDVPKS